MLILVFLHILARSEVNDHISDDSNENETQERTEEHSPELQGKAKYYQQQQQEIQIFESSKHYNASKVNTPTQDSTEINGTDYNNTDHNSTNNESNYTDHNSTNNESNYTDHNSTNNESNSTDQDQHLGKVGKLIESYFDKLDSRFNDIDERFNAIDERFNDIDERFNDIDERFNDIDNKFDDIDKKFDDIDERFNDIDKKFDDIDERFNSIDTRLDDISKQINTNYMIQNGEFSKNSSYNSTGIIQIYPKSDDGNAFASGNLVRIGAILFFSTCRHVIKTAKGLIRIIKLIKLYKGPVLVPEGPIYIFNIANYSYDYALIKINLTAYNNTDELFSRAATISNSSAVLSEIVRGITYRDVNLVYIQGQIVEVEYNYANIFQTDCGGTHGFSGSGYFDEHGKLKVIHKGGGYFLGEDELTDSSEFEISFFNKSNAPLLNSIKKAYNVCSKANTSDNESMNYCFGNVSSSISIHARNPRTMVLDASQLYNLFSNTTKNTIEVRQNDILKKINGKYELIKRDA